MRYPKDQRERTRRHVVETAARVLRRDGIAATGVLPLMREAGLTQGAFYKSFRSRDELLTEAIALATRQTRQSVRRRAAGEPDGAPSIDGLIASYLSVDHLDAPESGCVLAALGPELSRQSDPVRHDAAALIDDMLDEVAVGLPPRDRWIVRPLYMMMAGVLASARLAGSRAEQVSILADGRRAARLLAAGGEEVSTDRHGIDPLSA